MTDDLRAQVARIRPGDKVTATFRWGDDVWSVSGTALGKGSLWIAGPLDAPLRHVGGEPHTALVSIDSHEPVLPPEPPVGAVVVWNGKPFYHAYPHDWRDVASGGIRMTWHDLADGTVIFTPGGES